MYTLAVAGVRLNALFLIDLVKQFCHLQGILLHIFNGNMSHSQRVFFL